MIKNVFLDVDDTILDFHAAERVALTKTLKHFGYDHGEDILNAYSEINLKYWEKLERGEITRDEVMTGRFNETFRKFGYPENGYEAQLLYENLLCIGHWFMPGAVELLDTLKGRYDLYLVSNGSSVIQSSRLKSAGIIPYFRGIFVSEEIGAEKPSKEFFNRAVKGIEGYRAEESVIIGDSLTSDIMGGINAGMKTIWYNFNGKSLRNGIVPDYTVERLDEIPNLIETIK